MDALRQVLANIQKHLGQLSATHKLLIASLAVILAMGFFLVSQYAGRAKLVALMPDAAPADQQEAAAYLSSAGLEHEVGEDGRVMVPAARHREIFARMAQAGELPGDKSVLFSNVFDRQSWTMTKDQHRKLNVLALQNELARWIREFEGVAKASVFIDVPEPNGLGAAARRPTASAMIVTESGRPMDQRLVDAVAHWISGAVAGLDAANVRIVDAATGQQRSATDTGQLIPMTYLEYSRAMEASVREKVLSVVGHIPGVVVAVTAQVDVTRSSVSTESYLPKDEGSVAIEKRSTTNSVEEVGATNEREPGPRSNVQSDPSQASSGGTRSTQKDSDKEFETKIGKRTEQIVDPKGMPTRLAASVNIPRGFIAGLVKASAAAGAAAGGAATEPTDAQILARFDEERRQIEESLKPHLTTQARGPDGALTPVAGEVKVALVPVDVVPGTVAGGGILGGGGMGMALDSGLLDTAILGGLAVGAVGLMLMMVRRAAKKMELPTAEELVGLPPKLPTTSDLVGEADESETPMAGIEVGDDEIKVRKMLEQVQEMVKTDPGDAAKLIHRWVQTED